MAVNLQLHFSYWELKKHDIFYYRGSFYRLLKEIYAQMGEDALSEVYHHKYACFPEAEYSEKRRIINVSPF